MKIKEEKNHENCGNRFEKLHRAEGSRSRGEKKQERWTSKRSRKTRNVPLRPVTLMMKDLSGKTIRDQSNNLARKNAQNCRTDFLQSKLSRDTDWGWKRTFDDGEEQGAGWVKTASKAVKRGDNSRRNETTVILESYKSLHKPSKSY